MRKSIKELVMISICIITMQSIIASSVSTLSNTDKFSEQVLSVDMVINDVLYAGFSSKRITKFQPVADDIDTQHISKFKDSGESYTTTSFYVYGIASSDSLVKIKLDFGPNSKIGDSNEGQMYSIPSETGGNTNKVVPNLPVFLRGNDIEHPTEESGNIPNSLPVSFTVNPKNVKTPKIDTGGPVVPSNVSTNFICTDMLWLEIPKTAFENQTGVSGTYRAELILTLDIQ